MPRPKGIEGRRLCVKCHKEPMWEPFQFCSYCIYGYIKSNWKLVNEIKLQENQNGLNLWLYKPAGPSDNNFYNTALIF